MKRTIVVGSILVLLFCLGGLSVNGQRFLKQPFHWTYKVHKGGIIEVTVKKDKGTYLYEGETKVILRDRGGKILKPVKRPVPEEHYDAFLKKDISIFSDKEEQIWRFENLPKGVYKLVITYQGCRKKSKTVPAACFMPMEKTFDVSVSGAVVNKIESSGTSRVESKTASGLRQTFQLLNRFKITGRREGVIPAKEFVGFLKNETEQSSLFKDKSFVIIILLIILGGLGLNLTPCILPMIPINLAIIGAGMKATSKNSGIIRGGVYGAGIALTYGALGVFAIVTGAQFGALNSTVWFNIGIAIVFIVLALAMFDVFTIDFSSFSSKIGPKNSDKGGLVTIFLLGCVAALLAGACVAPVLIAVLLYSTTAYNGGHIIALFLPFLLGAGMALPWPIAGAGLSIMPKPGKWMMHIKHIFGVLILVMAGYYGYIGYTLMTPKRGGHGGDPIVNLEAGLKKAIAENRPVMIDFWATWCKNCSVMEQTTLSDPQVKKALNEYVVIKFNAENLNDPKLKAILTHFKVLGLPTFVTLQLK